MGNFLISTLAAVVVNFIFIDTPYRIALFLILAVGGTAAARWLDESLRETRDEPENQNQTRI
jgi:hypothetical protein